jgi:hypothetical protein
MPGRPRIHPDADERMRAYRKRIEEQDRGTIRVSSEWYEQNQADARRLIIAVWAAQRCEDPIALPLRTKTTANLMADLASYFEAGEIKPVQAPPARKQKGEDA